jgi:hypothetical protein
MVQSVDRWNGDGGGKFRLGSPCGDGWTGAKPADPVSVAVPCGTRRLKQRECFVIPHRPVIVRPPGPSFR